MKIWLVTIGEPLPIDGDNQRLQRAGMMAKVLANRGHEVTWWTSSFNHALKKDRCQKDETAEIDPNLRITMMYAPGYAKNVSLQRIANHLLLARRFTHLADKAPSPDIILAALPSIALAAASAEYGRACSVPVVLDIRDLWPDVFLDLAPAAVRELARIPLLPAFRLTARACRQATAIIGLTKPFVDWGLKHAGRPATSLDKEFFMGYTSERPGEKEIQQAEQYWTDMGAGKDDNEFIVSFFGHIGHCFDFDTVVKAARILNKQSRPIRFVLCGNGERVEYYRAQADDCTNILFPGWVNFPKIWVLLRRSAVGLAPYINIDNFSLNLPNKPPEYFSAALPVITGLHGVLSDLLEQTGTGVVYEAGNPTDLAQNLCALFDDPVRRRRMSDNARELYLRRFQADDIYGALANHLELVIDHYKQYQSGKKLPF